MVSSSEIDEQSNKQAQLGMPGSGTTFEPSDTAVRLIKKFDQGVGPEDAVFLTYKDLGWSDAGARIQAQRDIEFLGRFVNRLVD